MISNNNFEDWCTLMGRLIEGKVTLSNMIYDCLLRRISNKVFKKFIEKLENIWNVDKNDDYPEDIFKKIVDSDPSSFYCQGPDIPYEGRKCSRVMDVKDLMKNNIELKKIPFPIRSHPTDKDISLLQKLGFKDATRGKMRTRRPFAWVTKSDELDMMVKNVSITEKASVLRNALGLIHFDRDQYLVEIKYPDMKKVKLSAPTFLDGCPSIVFRSKNADDGWGRSVNLETLDDGLSEAIHFEIEFSDSFKLEKALGRLKPFKKVFNWEEFLYTLPNKWDTNSLEEIKRYVSK